MGKVPTADFLSGAYHENESSKMLTNDTPLIKGHTVHLQHVMDFKIIKMLLEKTFYKGNY